MIAANNRDSVGGVRGVIPLPQGKVVSTLTWKMEDGARRNYARLGRELSKKRPSLFRCGSDGHGLIDVAENGTSRLITKGSQLASVIVDTISLKIMKNGKHVGDFPPTMHLNTMVQAEVFLGHFRPLDHFTIWPIYLPNFQMAPPGYFDGGPGERLYYLGPSPKIATSTEAIDRFLGVMDFATNADRTNTVAAALTVLLRHRWLGEKPVILVTATKSHSGKGTITNGIDLSHK